MMTVEHLLHVQNLLGEGPRWVPAEQALYWVDIQNHLIYRYSPASGQHEVFDVGVRVTVLAPRRSGGFIAGTEHGFAVWHPGRPLEFLVNPEAHRPDIRFNDGAVDSRGRFWAGTMNDKDHTRPDGCLYRLDPDGSVHRMADGFQVYNGTAWSLDQRTMYCTDSGQRIIWAYDFDVETGAISNRRVFARIPESDGVPDGHTLDSEGYLWSTHWGGWKITRFDSTGNPEREVRLPVENVTSCTFGGAQLDELYITTARQGLSTEALSKQPLAGDLFRVKVGVAGLAQPDYAG